MRRWPIWSIPTAAAVTVVIVVLAGYASVVLGWVLQRAPAEPDLALAALLAATGVAYTELAHGLERSRATHLGRYQHTDFTSVWTFAGALLLPPTLAATVALVVHLHMCVRVRVSGGARYRQLYSNVGIVLASTAAAVVVSTAGTRASPSQSWAILFTLAAAAVFVVVNTGLLVLVVNLATGARRWWYGDDRVEVVTQALGVLLALLLDGPHPLFAVFLVPVLVMLHRAMSAEELQRHSAADETTGLPNTAGWLRHARREFRRASSRQSPLGVLLVDIDGLRHVNDDFGTQAGDRVLAAVADALGEATRPDDLLGAYGGGTLVVLLSGTDEADLMQIAQRMVQRIATLQVAVDDDDPPRELGVSASIGAAVGPEDGMTLEELLAAADHALKDAKDRGRGTVALRRDSGSELTAYTGPRLHDRGQGQQAATA